MGDEEEPSERAYRLGDSQAVGALDTQTLLGSSLHSGAPGYLEWTEIDTAHFLGNFPESVDLYATNFDGVGVIL